MPHIDLRVLRSSINILAGLFERGHKAQLFCNISSKTLGNERVYNEIVELLTKHKSLAQYLMLEIPQTRYRLLSPLERENLARLNRLGCELSMDQVYDLNLDCNALSNSGFRFIKVSAATLMNNIVNHPISDHPTLAADLVDRLRQENVALIASEVETELQAVSIADAEIGFGQGHLFAMPRPVKADLITPQLQEKIA